MENLNMRPSARIDQSRYATSDQLTNPAPVESMSIMMCADYPKDATTHSTFQSAYPKQAINQYPPPQKDRCPAVWTSPFGVAVAALGKSSDSEALTGAISAAVEAESQMRRGVAVAKSWWPSTLDYLRGYFAVSHYSVGYKLLAVYVPPIGYRYIWRNNKEYSSFSSKKYSKSSIDFMNDDAEHVSGDVRSSNHNIHHLGPDLYLPLMSFTTYIVLFGLSKATLDNFHPELLTKTASFAALITTIEIIIYALSFYILGFQLPLLELISAVGIKYESLVPTIGMSLLIGDRGYLYWCFFSYFACCAAHATFQSIRGTELRNRPMSEWGSPKGRSLGLFYFLCVIAIIQVALCWVLSPSTELRGGAAAIKLAKNVMKRPEDTTPA